MVSIQILSSVLIFPVLRFMRLLQVIVGVLPSERGNVSNGSAVVYYFALAGVIDGSIPLGQWQAGGSKIPWLRSDSGVLRTACD